MSLAQKFVVLSSLASFLVAPMALATEGASVPDDKPAAKAEKVTLTLDQRNCVITSLTKRENTLIAAEQVYASSWKTALEARRDGLVVAWGKESRRDRIAAQRVVANTFKTSKRAANDALLSARRTAWGTYKTERKACSPKAPNEDVISSSLENHN